jgi:hypothetical protein
MDAEGYERFTGRLQDSLTADDRVLGLVALGSMARQDTQPDRWSDHDFFVRGDFCGSSGESWRDGCRATRRRR